jgi:EmrB/QacA subfamily drug resistance transporter
MDDCRGLLSGGVRRYGAGLVNVVGPPDRRGHVEVASRAAVRRADPNVIELHYRTTPGRWVIAATVLGSGMAQIDGTVVGIALPAIGRDFAAGVTTLQWVVNAYTLTLAGLLLLGGALGDRLGRRRVFIIGTVWFAVASMAAGVAPTGPALIAARALQGVGAALLTPGSLAIIEASFVPDDRSPAIGAWSGLGGVAAAVGPFVGGWLISAVSWRSVFFINLPVAVAVVLISLRHVPESKDPTVEGRLDVTGAVLVTLGLVGVIYGLIEGPTHGWGSVTTQIALIGGAALLVAFVLVERRTAHPLMPLHLFRSTQFSAANGVTFAVYGGLGGALFLLPVALQEVKGYSPLEAGAALLPVTLLMLLLSARSGALAARIGPRLQMSVGPIVVGAGLALLSRATGAGNYLTGVLPGVVVFGLGLAATVAPLTATVLAAAPAENTGVASAINNDVARTASLVAVALLPAIAGITGESYTHPSELASAFRTAMLVSAVVCVAGGLLGACTIRNPPSPGPAPQRPESHCALDAPPLRSGPPG